MNEKIKIFFNGVAGSFACIGAVILAVIFGKNRRGADSDAGAGIKDAENTCKSTEATARELERATEQAVGAEQAVEQTNEQLATSIESSRRILEELKKRQSEK